MKAKIAKIIRQDENKKLIIIQSCAIILIVCVFLFFKSTGTLYILNDEFGYWGNSAILAGYDWDDLYKLTPYYSMGYSFFLYPIQLITSNTRVWYYYGLAMNLLFLICNYIALSKIYKKMFPEKSQIVGALLTLIVVIMPNAMIYSSVIWSESLLFLLFSLLTLSLMNLSEYINTKNLTSAFILISLIQLIHPRGFPVFALGLLFILYLLGISNRNRKDKIILICISIAVGAFIYFLSGYIKSWQVSCFMGNSPLSAMNSMSASSLIIDYIYKLIYEFKTFLFSFLGKLLEAILSTNFVFLVPFFCWANNIMKHRAQCEPWYKIRKDSLILLWIIIVPFCLVLLSSFQMANWWERKDIIAYSRYFDFTLSPLYLIGLSLIVFHPKKYRMVLLISFSYFLLVLRPIYQKIKFAGSAFNSICSPLFGVFIDSFPDIKLAFFVLAVVFSIIGLLLIVYSYFPSKLYMRYLLTLLAITSTLISCAGLVENSGDQNRDYLQTISIAKEINASDSNVIYIEDQDLDFYSVKAKMLQFLIPDKGITVLSKEDFMGLSNDSDEFEDVVIVANTADLEVYKAVKKYGFHDSGVKDSYLRLYITEEEDK